MIIIMAVFWTILCSSKKLKLQTMEEPQWKVAQNSEANPKCEYSNDVLIEGQVDI